MSAIDILTLIDAEIATLQQVRAQLDGAAKRGPGRPKSTRAPVAKKKRKMSPEGPARLIAAVKARWAAQKKAGK
jgi:hypothetical protein